MTSKLRQRILASTDERLAALEGLVEKQGRQLARQLARQRARLDTQQATQKRLEARLARQGERVDRQAERLAKHKTDVAGLTEVATRVNSVVDVLAHQTASLEARLADVDERFATTGPAGPGELDEARSFVDEIRSEHARIRERFGVVTAFEERLRRLEDALLVDTRKTLEEFEATARALAAELDADAAATSAATAAETADSTDAAAE